jgi:HTH-type transcriptional regulator/antitoxin HigA
MWATDSLIPPDRWKAWRLSRRKTSKAMIISFAEELKISPAIPAGRLRYQKSDYSIYKGLIGARKVRCLFELGNRD